MGVAIWNDGFLGNQLVHKVNADWLNNQQVFRRWELVVTAHEAHQHVTIITIIRHVQA